MPIHTINYEKYITPSDYVKFGQGDTVVRIISKGGLCKMHGMKTARGYVNLGICTEDDSCENCQKGYEAKTRWIWVVYLPEFEVVRIMEVGKKAGDAICKIAKNEGDPQEYELIVTRTGEMLKTDYKVRMGNRSKLDEKLLEKLNVEKEFLVSKRFK